MNGQLRHDFSDISLVTIPPPIKDDSVLLEKPPIQEIFTGKLVIKEFLTTGQNDNSNSSLSSSLPRSSLLFQFVYDDSKDEVIFCDSNILDNLYKFREFIRESGNNSKNDSYDITVEVLKMRIPLQLKIKSSKEEMAFKDLLVRFKDEFELIEDMYYI
ncbi:hypothetical protein ACO0SA_001946 [Hanseniaspora valbyensis]